MSSFPRAAAQALLGLLLLAATVGCAGKYTVSGKVTRGGKPIAWQTESNLLLVHFAPVDREKNRALFPAKTDTSACTYTIKDVPAGKYLVAVHLLDPAPKIDALNLAYNLVHSPLTYEVTGNAVHDIDLPVEVPNKAQGPTTPDQKTTGSPAIGPDDQ